MGHSAAWVGFRHLLWRFPCRRRLPCGPPPPAGPCFSSAPTPAGAAVSGSVGPGSATLLRSAPTGAVESLPAGSCFSSASRRSRARQRGARLRDTLAVRPRRGGGELAGRFLFLEHAYAGRRSRARQRGTRLPGRHDTLAGELARLGGRGNRWKAVILGREQSLVGNCRPLILGLRR